MSEERQPVIGYHFYPEAWYAATMPETEQGERHMGIGKYYPDGGCTWELSIREHMHNPNPATSMFLVPRRGVMGIKVDVGVFDDAWVAYTEIPEFFSALAQLSTHDRHGWHNHGLSSSECPYTLDTIRELADRLGYVDLTNRDAPSGYDTLLTQVPPQSRGISSQAIKAAYDTGLD